MTSRENLILRIAYSVSIAGLTAVSAYFPDSDAIRTCISILGMLGITGVHAVPAIGQYVTTTKGVAMPDDDTANNAETAAVAPAPAPAPAETATPAGGESLTGAQLMGIAQPVTPAAVSVALTAEAEASPPVVPLAAPESAATDPVDDDQTWAGKLAAALRDVAATMEERFGIR